MPVRVVYLGSLRDLAGVDCVELPGPLAWEQLLAAVPKAVAEEIKLTRVKIACGGRVLAVKQALQAEDGEEVALLPPVSGG